MGFALALILALPFAQAQDPGSGAPSGASGELTGAPGPTGSESSPGRALPQVPDVDSLIQPFVYEPRGRRDPFAQPVAEQPVRPGEFHGPVLPLQRIALGDLKLVGVLWDVKEPRAILDHKGKRITVTLYTKIGVNNGYVAAIREGEIVIVELEEQGGRRSPVARVIKIGS